MMCAKRECVVLGADLCLESPPYPWAFHLYMDFLRPGGGDQEPSESSMDSCRQNVSCHYVRFLRCTGSGMSISLLVLTQRQMAEHSGSCS